MDAVGSIKQQVREFLLEIAQQKGIGGFAEDASLTNAGIVDSLAIFRLVAFLEETFGIRIADDEIMTENFETLDGIEQFVLAKLGRSGRG